MDKSIYSIRQALVALLLLCAVAARGQEESALMTIDPTPGEVPQLSEFHLYFNGDWALGSQRTAKITLSGPDGFFIPSMLNQSNGKYVTIYISDEVVISTPGEYVLTIPAHKYKVNGRNIEETTFTYVITDDGVTFPEYVVTPEPGTYSDISDGFRIVFDTDEDVEVTESLVALYGPDGEVTTMVESPANIPWISVIPVNAAGNPVALTAEGDYMLVFGRSSVKVGEMFNTEPIRLGYVVTTGGSGNWDGTMTVNPAEGSEVENLKDVLITFNGAKTVKINDQASANDFPKLRECSTGATVTGATVFAKDNVLDISLLTEVTAPGEYELEIPASLMKIDNTTPSRVIFLVYTVAGGPDALAGVSVDSVSNDVYSLTGVLVLRNADAAAIRRLPSGIYIISGRKIIIGGF